jgi:squalene-associated FAD-dependent desaturase
MRPRAVRVIGAGIAGLSAAVRLAEAGLQVIVHEAAQVAGGRCRSYADQALGLVIDNGNHLLLSGNRAALDYLNRIGSAATMSGPAAATFDFADLRSGERWRLTINDGRLPWWLLDRSRRAPGTSLREYFAPLPMIWRAPASQTIAEAMTCAGPLYDRLWRPLLLAGLNTEPKEASAALAAGLMRETLWAGGRACHPLVAGRGLSHSFVEPALAYLAARGAEARLGERLRTLHFEGPRAIALDFDGVSVPLAGDEAVVIATPPWAAQELLPGLEAPDEFRAIVNAHFRVAPSPAQPAILGVVNGLTEWLFAYPDRLSTTISGADGLIDHPREKLAADIWLEVATLTGLPATPIPPWRILKEKRATFAATPEQNRKRPPARTRFDNVALAGDWTATGLPATIEGAVRSGYKAASIILGIGATAPRPVVASVSS